MPERDSKEAILPAWSSEKGDADVTDDATLAKLVQSRKLISVLDLQDYDHDGYATEFVLPVGGVGCAFHGSVAVGISRKQPVLHVLGTAKHPDTPRVLSSRGWQVLRSRGTGTYVDVECGFRGADVQVEVELKTDLAGIHVAVLEYACPPKSRQLLSRVEH
jgi:hypothetical protein